MWSFKKVEVKTPLGPVKGNKIDSYNGFPIYTFQGIPYAKPPVGDLRFKDPVPIEPWTKVVDATKAPSPAPQMNLNEKKLELVPNSSEDCLYLNVYTPQAPDGKSKLPVMVWIHGGGFTVGEGSRDLFGPDYLVPQGIILVTMNYRLGAFGFLSFQNEECPGNYGLKDQAQALRWVQENISSFGGDPDNVTLFGQSASVQYQMLSPTSRGLFHKAIAQSGSALNRWAYSKRPVDSGLLLAKRLGVKTTDPHEAFKAIKAAPAGAIVKNSDCIHGELAQSTWAGEHLMGFSFVPTAEPVGTPNAFLTKTPEQALEDGDYADVPFIQGVCSCETSFCALSANYVPLYSQDEDYQLMLPKELDVPLNSEKSVAAAGKLRQFYFPNGNTREGYLKAQSAVWFVHGVHRTMTYHLNNKNRKSPNFLYIFDETRHPSALRTLNSTHEIPGASHADDLEFLFYPNQIAKLGKKPVDPSSKEGRVSALLTKLWTDFAKDGAPAANWPPTESKTMNYAFLTDKMEVKEGFFKEEMQFWDDLYKFMKTAVITRDIQKPAPWTLLYADDITIAANTKENLTYEVQVWSNQLSYFGLRLNVRKTVYMSTDRHEKDTINVNGSDLAKAETFKAVSV